MVPRPYWPRCGKHKSLGCTCGEVNPAEPIKAAARAKGGFLDAGQLQLLAQHEPHCNVLVRCGNGRFCCAAQSAQHFIDIITRDGQDYVRDVSLPV